MNVGGAVGDERRRRKDEMAERMGSGKKKKVGN